jgi:hypothetical protein
MLPECHFRDEFRASWHTLQSFIDKYGEQHRNSTMENLAALEGQGMLRAAESGLIQEVFEWKEGLAQQLNLY